MRSTCLPSLRLLLRPPWLPPRRPPPPTPHRLLPRLPDPREHRLALGCRRTRGDGNCFFRSFFFGYLEHLLLSGDGAERDRAVRELEGLKKSLVEVGGYDEIGGRRGAARWAGPRRAASGCWWMLTGPGDALAGLLPAPTPVPRNVPFLMGE